MYSLLCTRFGIVIRACRVCFNRLQNATTRCFSISIVVCVVVVFVVIQMSVRRPHFVNENYEISKTTLNECDVRV